MKQSFFRKRLLALVAAAGICASAGAQTDTSAIAMALNSNKDKNGRDYMFMMYYNGNVVYKRQTGDFNLRTQQPIGAASQWLTAALVMMLVDEGKLTLDDKVSDYLPVFAKFGKGYITIGHCLSFSTGIHEEQGILKPFQKSRFKSLEDEVNEYASKRQIETNPGTAYQYSHIGFNIAARVLEVISRKPFDRLVTEKLLRPLAMRNTTFANEDYNNAINAASGARSTAGDYLNFLQMLLNKGSFNGKQVLKAESVAALLGTVANAGAVKNAPKAGEGLAYTYGTWVLEAGADGKPIAFAAPSLGGSWPVLDVCRGYAFMLLTRPQGSEATRQYLSHVKASVDDQLPAKCN